MVWAVVFLAWAIFYSFAHEKLGSYAHRFSIGCMSMLVLLVMLALRIALLQIIMVYLVYQQVWEVYPR